MAAPRINMRKLKDALRLKLEGGRSHQQIAAALGISKGVVTKYVGLAVAAGLDWPTVAAMDEAALERQLLSAPRPSDIYAQPDYGRVHQELHRKGMTLALLWEEYCAQVGDEHDPEHPVKAWRYSQFCENYRQFAKRLKRSMRQVHRAEICIICLIAIVMARSPTSLQPRKRQATTSPGHAAQTPALVGRHCTALTFYGGVSQLIVPDNPRALVTKADRYEPNSTTRCATSPATTAARCCRAYHPQDKPKSSSACTGSADMALRKPVRQCRKSKRRHCAFVQGSTNAFQARAAAPRVQNVSGLMALPATWGWAASKPRVHIDSHIEFEAHRYSVLNALVGWRWAAGDGGRLACAPLTTGRARPSTAEHHRSHHRRSRAAIHSASIPPSRRRCDYIQHRASGSP